METESSKKFGDAPSEPTEAITLTVVIKPKSFHRPSVTALAIRDSIAVPVGAYTHKRILPDDLAYQSRVKIS